MQPCCRYQPDDEDMMHMQSGTSCDRLLQLKLGRRTSDWWLQRCQQCQSLQQPVLQSGRMLVHPAHTDCILMDGMERRSRAGIMMTCQAEVQPDKFRHPN